MIGFTETLHSMTLDELKDAYIRLLAVSADIDGVNSTLAALESEILEREHNNKEEK